MDSSLEHLCCGKNRFSRFIPGEAGGVEEAPTSAVPWEAPSESLQNGPIHLKPDKSGDRSATRLSEVLAVSRITQADLLSMEAAADRTRREVPAQNGRRNPLI